LNFSLSNRGSVLVFLITLLAASLGTSGCIGVTSPANSTPAVLNVTPTAVSVATVVGNTGSQTVTATNPGTTNVLINQISVTGKGFTTTGLVFPATLAPGASKSFAVAFQATTPGTALGSLSIMTDASANPVVVQLSATASSAGSTPPPGSGVTSVSVNPATASTTPSGALSFAATIQGTATDTSVTWAATSGTITSAGKFTAPSSAGTATITATSVADTTKSASATVTISATSTPAVSSVSVSPTTPSIATDGTLQFSASVQGSTTNKSVTWIAQRGSISSAGAYVAPSSSGTDTVTATSAADTSKFSTATITVSTPVASGALSAFPGAQGGGAASAGGRGGQVFEVTNLNDSGAGSLRDCTKASGPRTCIFRVAGIIAPAAKYIISNPFITIACQTAPGEVIIGGPHIASESLFITTHDVTVRYCTFSGDNINVPAGPNTGTVNIEIANGDNYNIILDHVTSRWAGNKLWISLSNYVGPNRMITTQWSMFYEPHAHHPVGPGNSTNPNCNATSSSPCFSAGERDIDFHHNLFADMSHRIPESTNHSTRFVNNIIFNWNFYASEWLGAMVVDEIGNKYVAGNLNVNAAQKHEIHFTTKSPPLPGNPSTYLSGNIGPNLSDPSGNQYLMASQIDGENGDETGSIPSAWIRSSPMSAPAFPIKADPVGSLDDVLLGTIGNSQHLDCSGNWISHRDSADARIVNQYKTRGNGGYWPNGLTSADDSIPTPSSPWTDQPVTNFSACTESQHDGIPDQWKTAHGLSTTDPNLHKSTAPNGYTYLENYLSGPQ
jgi:pectate lyase